MTAETAGDAAAWRATYYAYDARGRVLEKAVFDADDALVSRETCTYDDAASGGYAVVTKTLHGDADAADQTTVTYTDKYGDTVRTSVAGVVTSYAYDYVGNAVRSFYGTTTLAAYTYDFRGNVLTETDALGNTRSFTYDALGRKTAESDCKGNITTYAYDLAGRLLTVTAPLSDTTDAVTVYTYDANGNVLRTEQTAQADDSAVPTWRTVEQTYDAMNRVTDIAETADGTHKVWTHYAYNAAGDLTDVYTGLSAKWSLAVNPETYSHTHYAYDARGRVDTLTDALGQSETYTYDPLGTPLGAVLRDGTTTAYTYSPLGAVTSRIGSMTTGTAYTATGAVAQTTADGETVAYTYNPAGGILTETAGDSVKTYTYDHRGRQASFTLTVGGETVGTTTYAYDLLDRVTAVTADGVETTYTYDANGNRASQTTGAVTTTYTYNKANLVTGMVNTLLNDDGEDVVISEFAYTYYADGNQRTKTETLLGGDPITTTYVYDGLGRLTSETKGEDSITYTYDASGNRVGMNRNGTVTAYAYDANNRLLSETVGDTVTTYTYDANGNTLTAGDKTYTYNDRGQQIGFANETVSASYAYNPSGLRKAKTVGGSTKYFVYNGMNIVYEYSESVADSVAYFYGLNRTHNSEGEIYVYNAHGDVVQLVKDNSVVASYTYDAFGNLTSQIGESDNPFLYCGEYYDAETQTYYLRARYYNPANGRFTQQDAWSFMDASDPLSLNLYTYCCNNPVMYVDPHGNFAILATLATIAVGAAIGAVIDAGAQLIQNGGNVKDINWRSVGASAAAGAVTTGLAMLTGGVSLGVEATMAWGALTGAAGYVTYNTVNGSEMSAEGMLTSMATGALVRGVAYKISNPNTNGLLSSNKLGTTSSENITVVQQTQETDSTTRLYRVVSIEEYDSIISSGKFSVGGNSLEEKWFATTGSNAMQWGSHFYPDGQCRIVYVDVPSEALTKMYYNSSLDGIGAGYCSNLDLINNSAINIGVFK